MKTYPYMPFYIQDWFSDPEVQSLTYEEQGIYITLLGRLWESDDAMLPDDDAYLSRILRLTSRKWARVRAVLIDGPTAVLHTVDGRLTQKRLREEFFKARHISERRAEAGKRGGDAKAHNRALAAQRLTHKRLAIAKQTSDVPPAKRSHTDPDTDPEKERVSEKESDTPIPSPAQPDAVTDFVDWFPALVPLRSRLACFPDRDLGRITGEELTALLTVHHMGDDLLAHGLQEALDRRKPMAYALAILRTYRDRHWTSLADAQGSIPEAAARERFNGQRASPDQEAAEDLARAAAVPLYPMPVIRRPPGEAVSM